MTKRNQITYKIAHTIKPYKVSYKGWDIEVPVGSKVVNRTAMGNNDSYRFWSGWRNYAEKLTGFKNSTLAHYLTYYGLNIPAEYCEHYTN